MNVPNFPKNLFTLIQPKRQSLLNKFMSTAHFATSMINWFLNFAKIIEKALECSEKIMLPLIQNSNVCVVH